MSQFGGFSKPILLFDFESTGFVRDASSGDVTDPGEPTQIGAVLLDPITLDETKHYLSDIRADPEKLDPWVLEHTDMTPERAAAGPPREQVAHELVDAFGLDFYLCSWNVTFDRIWLDMLMQAIGRRETTFDYHHLDAWTLAYTYLCQHGHPETIRSEDVFGFFGQSARQAHNALDDCRRTAAVLRSTLLLNEKGTNS